MTFGGGFGSVFRPAFDPGLTALPWYRAGGAPLPVAAYQPKGASSLAASYVNLVSPGTYDAAPQGSPGWDEENGWKNFTTVDYLNTGIKPGATYSAVVRHAGSVGTTDNGFGGYEAPNRFYLGRSAATGYVGHGGYYQLSTQFATGVSAITANGYYRNGNLVATFSAPWSGGAWLTATVFIGRINHALQSTSGNIQAVVIWSTTLTAPQVAAVSAAMAAL